MWRSTEYTIDQVLYEDERVAVYRGLRIKDRRRVVIKAIGSAHRRPQDLDHFKNAYDMGTQLNIKAVVKPLTFEVQQNSLAIVFEDFGGESLDRKLGAGMKVGGFLRLAIKLAEAVADLHTQGIVHRNIKPQNILIHPTTEEVKLAGLELATRLPLEHLKALTPQQIEGSLPYMSPEQTGRMNRVVDNRSDLYALGMVFYEMLTGSLPFEAADPLEWIHNQVARVPESPSDRIPSTPRPVADVIMKLLVKMADDRYQSAIGLKTDLEICRNQWQASGHIEPFALGSRDISELFRMPQKLYGREAESETLVRTLKNIVNSGTTELVLVTGYSGIGKTSLVQELYRPIVRECGYFISGKFDQYKRGIPYDIISQAFAELVQHLLVQNEEQITSLKSRLLASLGINTQVLIDVVPELERIVGQQPPAPEVGFVEAQSRIHLVFRQFLGAVTELGHPLIIFLDDLQWVDAASLKLVEMLSTHPDTYNVLLIGAYRDNEVTSTHPLRLAFDEIEKSKGALQKLFLDVLSFDQICQMIGDAAHTDVSHVLPLAKLVVKKTSGNPFFTIRFLMALREEDLIIFDRQTLRWTWDLAKIEEKGFSDNVIDLMIRKFHRLSLGARNILRMAAAIGNQFDFTTLAAIYGGDPGETYALLDEVIGAGLVHRSNSKFMFQHDRIQEAAYLLTPEVDRAGMHLQIARMWLATYADTALKEHLFEIVGQFNSGRIQMTDSAEKRRLAGMNLQAAKRAIDSSAFGNALEFSRIAWELLDPADWQTDYSLQRQLYGTLAEVEFLNSNLARSEELITAALGYLRTDLEKADFLVLLIVGQTLEGAFAKAVQSGRVALALLGISLPVEDPEQAFQEAVVKIDTLLGNRSPIDLLSGPLLADPVQRVAQKILLNVDVPAYFSEPAIHPTITAQMVQISLRYGNSMESCKSFAVYGMLIGMHCGQFKRGYEFGKLGWELVDRLGAVAVKCKTTWPWGVTQAWVKPLRETLPCWQVGIQAGYVTGDLQFIGYLMATQACFHYVAGDSVSQVRSKVETGLFFTKTNKNQWAQDSLQSLFYAVQGLQSEEPLSVVTEDEGSFLVYCTQRGNLSSLCIYHTYRAQRLIFDGQPKAALEHAEKAQQMTSHILGFLAIIDANFYHSLALAQVHPLGSTDELSRAIKRKLGENQARLKVWMDAAPENCTHKYKLIEAEIARLSGQELEAIHLYEQAILAARKNGFIQDEALAYELAAQFYENHGFEIFFKAYLQKAYSRYQRWGADAKVKTLDRSYSWLAPPQRMIAPTPTVCVGMVELDFLSVIKASQTISQSIKLEDLSKTLMQVLLEQGGAERGCLILSRERQLTLQVVAEFDQEGVRAELLPAVPVEGSTRVPESIIRFVVQTGKPVILEDAVVNSEQFKSDEYLMRKKPRSVLCTPIWRQAKVVGYLYLENALVSGVFSHERLAILDLLSTQAAISIENAYLLSQELSARKEAEEEHKKAAFLAEAGVLLSESLEYEVVLNRLSQLLVQRFAEWCEFDMLQENLIYRRAGAHCDPTKMALVEELARRYPVQPGSPHPSGKVLESGEPLLLSEITDEVLHAYSMDEEHARLIQALGTKTVLVVPLQARGRLLGVLTLASAKPGHHYGLADLGLAMEISRRAAMAIENAHLYSQAQKAIQVREDFMAVASHELRTPLTPLKLQLQLLVKFLQTEITTTSPRARDFIKLIETADNNIIRLSKLVDDLLEVSRISAGRMTLNRERVDLVELTRDVIERFASELEKAKCDLKLSADTLVIGQWDRLRVEQVVVNLLTNAMKYGVGKSIKITLSAQADHALFVVQDFGIGIAQEDQARIFDRFERAVSAKRFGGLGMGLYIARQIIAAHGGFIRVESEPDHGSTFIVELPFLCKST